MLDICAHESTAISMKVATALLGSDPATGQDTASDMDRAYAYTRLANSSKSRATLSTQD